MGSKIQRSVLSQAVVTAAQAVGKPIGDGEAPRGGVAGWVGGQPNQEGTNFIPYSVVTPLVSSVREGPFDDPQADVNLPYLIASYGISREQVEWMSDNVRLAIADLEKQAVTMWAGTVHQENCTIMQVWETQIGGIVRISQEEPPVYSQSDVVTLWTTR